MGDPPESMAAFQAAFPVMRSSRTPRQNATRKKARLAMRVRGLCRKSSSGLIRWNWGSANRDVVRLTEVFRIDVENSQNTRDVLKIKRSKFIFQISA
jgi:hypothetical protein